MKQVKVPIKGQFENYANPRAHNELKHWPWKMESLDALAFIVSPIKTGRVKLKRSPKNDLLFPKCFRDRKKLAMNFKMLNSYKKIFFSFL